MMRLKEPEIDPANDVLRALEELSADGPRLSYVVPILQQAVILHGLRRADRPWVKLNVFRKTQGPRTNMRVLGDLPDINLQKNVAFEACVAPLTNFVRWVVDHEAPREAPALSEALAEWISDGDPLNVRVQSDNEAQGVLRALRTDQPFDGRFVDPSGGNNQASCAHCDKHSETTASDVPEALLQPLKEARDNKNFTDLHAHLLGMGDKEFWIKLLDDYKQGDRERMLVWNEEKREEMSWGEDAFEYVKRKGKAGTAISADDIETRIVFSIATLYRALDGSKGVKDDVGSDEEERVEKLLRIAEKRLVKDYVIWDARKQTVCKRRGICIDEFLEATQNPNKKIAHRVKILLNNCFEMLGPCSCGTPHDAIRAGIYQDQFSYQFYPRRYALKDDMYSQYLDVIKDLVEHVAKRYASNGVGYAELSIGVNDVMRPWITERLLPQTEGVTLKYLAMFSRTTEFRDQLKTLKELEKFLQNEEARIGRPLDWLVGLDYASDEKKYSACPFHLLDFQHFLKERLAKTNGAFGYRIHAAEWLPPAGKHNEIIKHLEEIAETVVPLLKEFGKRIPGRPCPIRIGHGIGFAYLLEKQHSSRILAEMLELLKKHQVAIEVCNTSNQILVADDADRHRYWERLLNKFNVIFATDNDGIWKCQTTMHGGEYHSVAAEYALALQHVPNMKLKRMIGRSQMARFQSQRIILVLPTALARSCWIVGKTHARVPSQSAAQIWAGALPRQPNEALLASIVQALTSYLGAATIGSLMGASALRCEISAGEDQYQQGEHHEGEGYEKQNGEGQHQESEQDEDGQSHTRAIK